VRCCSHHKNERRSLKTYFCFFQRTERARIIIIILLLGAPHTEKNSSFETRVLEKVDPYGAKTRVFP
jgi:hypothetical protein